MEYADRKSLNCSLPKKEIAEEGPSPDCMHDRVLISFFKALALKFSLPSLKFMRSREYSSQNNSYIYQLTKDGTVESDQEFDLDSTVEVT